MGYKLFLFDYKLFLPGFNLWAGDHEELGYCSYLESRFLLTPLFWVSMATHRC